MLQSSFYCSCSRLGPVDAGGLGLGVITLPFLIPESLVIMRIFIHLAVARRFNIVDIGEFPLGIHLDNKLVCVNCVVCARFMLFAWGDFCWMVAEQKRQVTGL